MSTKELIVKELSELPEEKLVDVYELVKSLRNDPLNSTGKTNLLTALSKMNLEGPTDWSRNIDSYLYGTHGGNTLS
jgi:hypothetical protein